MDLTVSSLEQLLEALLGRLDHQLDYGTILRAKLLQSIQNLSAQSASMILPMPSASGSTWPKSLPNGFVSEPWCRSPQANEMSGPSLIQAAHGCGLTSESVALST